MSATDLVSILTLLIQLGNDFKNRLDSINYAAEALDTLNLSLSLLLKIFENPAHEDIIKTHVTELTKLFEMLESIKESCKKWAKAISIKTDAPGKRIFKQVWVSYKIQDILEEIERKTQQLQSIYNMVTVILIGTPKEPTSKREIVESVPIPNRGAALPENLLDRGVGTDLASIDLVMGSLIRECKNLRQRLQEATIFPDTSALQEWQAQNPEAASFWKDRFFSNELSISALRYEALYVSWARFVHEIETSLVLKRIPTGDLRKGNIDAARQRGSQYYIDQSGTRRLSTVRPLWLPALRSALDPLHKGYVKPRDYFDLLQDSSLGDTLRRLALESAGYGTIVECERASADLSLPAAIESPSHHVGWISAQIVAVPTPNELGIVMERDIISSNENGVFAYFKDTTPPDVKVYVRYLETGQIECKSLSKQVRPIGGISVGAALSIQHDLESGGHAWSGDLSITEFKACYGGQYIITAGMGPTAITFSTRPLKDSLNNNMLRNDDDASTSTIPELDYTLLGPSKAFTEPPKVGEKVQIESQGLWYDSRVTAVDGDEIEYTDWNSPPTKSPTDVTTEAQDDEEETYGLFFSEEQLTQLGKGTRRLWQPWRRNIDKYDVRPYRCFHIGDAIEAPVMYPDFRFHYHTMDNSQLYLPARIVDVKGDQYVIEFSPALSVLRWWPGRMARGEKVDLVPGSDLKVENPFDFNRVTLGMDQARPLSMGPRPTLGTQSVKPPGWSSFQGVHFGSLEDLFERSLAQDVFDAVWF